MCRGHMLGHAIRMLMIPCDMKRVRDVTTRLFIRLGGWQLSRSWFRPYIGLWYYPRVATMIIVISCQTIFFLLLADNASHGISFFREIGTDSFLSKEHFAPNRNS